MFCLTRLGIFFIGFDGRHLHQGSAPIGRLDLACPARPILLQWMLWLLGMCFQPYWCFLFGVKGATERILWEVPTKVSLFKGAK